MLRFIASYNKTRQDLDRVYALSNVTVLRRDFSSYLKFYIIYIEYGLKIAHNQRIILSKAREHIRKRSGSPF